MSNKPTETEWVAHVRAHHMAEQSIVAWVQANPQAFSNFYQPRSNDMKAQAKINGWSALNTGDGIAVKHLGGSALEVCLSVDGDGELVINVYQGGVDEPVFVANVREST